MPAVPQEQEQKRTQRKGGDEGGGEGDASQVQSASKAEELKEEMDEILDEIDSVLEENAEEFIKSYVQKGGEGRTTPPASRSVREAPLARTPASLTWSRETVLRPSTASPHRTAARTSPTPTAPPSLA